MFLLYTLHQYRFNRSAKVSNPQYSYKHCTAVYSQIIHLSFNTQCQNREANDFSFVQTHSQLIVVFFESLVTQLPHNINNATTPLSINCVNCPVIKQWLQSKTPQIIINSSLTPWFETI